MDHIVAAYRYTRVVVGLLYWTPSPGFWGWAKQKCPREWKPNWKSKWKGKPNRKRKRKLKRKRNPEWKCKRKEMRSEVEVQRTHCCRKCGLQDQSVLVAPALWRTRKMAAIQPSIAIRTAHGTRTLNTPLGCKALLFRKPGTSLLMWRTPLRCLRKPVAPKP